MSEAIDEKLIMSLAGNDHLARDVASAVEDWTPSEAYGHESKFQNELQEYLDRRLNADSGMMLGANEEIVVEREHGNVNGDVAVNGDIGIEMKRDLDNGQTNTLRGQISQYQKEYTHVIVVACGIDDMDGWRKIKNDYNNQMGMDMDPDNAPVKFIHKRKANYGEGESADDYDQYNSSQQGAELEELANVVENGIKGYKSLTGDGPMDTGEAVIAVVLAVTVIGFILVLVGVVVLSVL